MSPPNVPAVPRPLSVRDHDLLVRMINRSVVTKEEIGARAWSSDEKDPMGAAMMTAALTLRPVLAAWLLDAGVNPNVIAWVPHLERTPPSSSGGRTSRGAAGNAFQILWPPIPEQPSSALRQALCTASPAALDALLTAGARWDRWETPLVDPLRFLATVPRPIRQDKACFRQDQLARLEVMVQHGHTLSPHAAGLVVFDAIGSMERTTSPDLIARLIDLGADPFVVAGDDRRTALHQAMKLLSEDRAAHAHALLDRGLDPLARDAHGLTPVDLLLQRLAEETWVSDIDRMLLNRLERGVLDATLAQHNRATLASSTPRSRL